MTLPVISVLMPVYNAEKFLKEAIESILRQTFTSFEFIIINDGSTDSSLEIIEEFAKRDSRIKYINRKNKGLIESLNEGIEISQGKYIARMDSDDVSFPKRLEVQYEFLEQNSEYVVVGSRVILIDEDGDELCPMVNLFSNKDIDSAHINNLTNGAVIVHPTAMIRRSSLVKIGGYRHDYKNAEDIDVWLRLSELGKVCNLDDVFLKYRQHFDSIGYSCRESQLKSIKNAVNDARIRRGLENSEYQVSSAELYISKTKIDIYIKWGWWALAGGGTVTARKYAKKAMLSSPFKWEVWKLLFCSLRGY